MFARSLGLISAFFMAISVAGAEPATKPAAKPVIAVFDLAGQMGETPVDESMAIFGPPGLSLRDVVTRIDKAAKDPDVKGVVVLADESAFGLGRRRNCDRRCRRCGRRGRMFMDMPMGWRWDNTCCSAELRE